ncbi:peptidoglycan DD-metalloendopeptidase family protein [Pseudoalteromonas xiamenensis]|uniref:peptidoglycan DD-metalloendopeptidase family protein n=1 Tax=Pseudoalteromonas xiamenensis TaxID=882626 RepID=UPI0027E4F4A0|nr:peptidoglycan DD-metalloendopeptidase family protein [Pseudoalteromonas xiamenensis]WMN59054.1 peptidoglycan DD-metalloendopeptidase family protein [Pseudoalteromonas xiamenensis]
MLHWRVVTLLSLCIALSACSSRQKPAPVSSLDTRQTSSTQKINIKGSSYVVKQGDTLFSIAFAANQDYRTVAKRNNIPAPFTIYPGQKLYFDNSNNKNKKRKKYTNLSNKSSSQQRKYNKIVKKDLDPKNQPEYVQKEVNKKSSSTNQLDSKGVHWIWPTSGKITQRFSIKENGYKGLQISNKQGTNVVAAAGGVVVYAGNALRGYGNLIILKHDDDYLSAYAHNSKLLVREQQQVKVGQKIAEMGSTDAESSALRFEIRFRGQSVDPVIYLPKN